MDLLDCFPFDVFRFNQKETILAIQQGFDSGKKFVILEAPTGAGKSPIGYTLAKYEFNTFTLTPQKLLQDQYMKDFGDELVDLKGRNAYECTLANRNLNEGDDLIYCDKGICKVQGKPKLIKCVKVDKSPGAEVDLNTILCPYFRRLKEAQMSPLTLFNFQSFFFQAIFARTFHKRGMMVIDEAHNTETELLRFVSLSLSDRDFSIDFPELPTPELYLQFFEEIRLDLMIKQKMEQAKLKHNPAEHDRWESVLTRYAIIVHDVTEYEFISEFKKVKKGKREWHTVELKPLYVDHYAHKCLFSYADRVILMSATVLNPSVLCSNLGIDVKDALFITLPSTFPAANRKAYFMDVGSMNWKSKKETLPKLLLQIMRILDHHKDHRGIIHTHNFEIAYYIRDNIDERYLERLLYQDKFRTKYEMLEHHANHPNSVIVAPAMHEGVDLKDDLSRFQVLCKVPYPNPKADKRLDIRMKKDWKYYAWLTCLKLVQSYGRSVRSKDDWALTYILDSQFKAFYNQNKGMLPDWFKEAIVW